MADRNPAAYTVGVDTHAALKPTVNPTMMSQFGGACGCAQRGGGSGSGGYYQELTNELGKAHAGYQVYPCPSAPVENPVFQAQKGGAAVDEIGIVSYPSGYGYSPKSVVDTGSAQYLNQLPYNKGQAGGRRRRRTQRRRRV